LAANIDALFSDNRDGSVLTLATVHKSKGLEWDRVFILDPKLMPSKYARQQWQLDQETNIHYVAITRARQELYYIDSEGFQKPIEIQPEPPQLKVDPATPQPKKLKLQQMTVQRVDQSPMNPSQWCLTLSCGHELWVTAKRRPQRMKAGCERCQGV